MLRQCQCDISRTFEIIAKIDLGLAYSEFTKGFPRVCRPEMVDYRSEKDPYIRFNTPLVYIKDGLNPMLMGSSIKKVASVS